MKWVIKIFAAAAMMLLGGAIQAQNRSGVEEIARLNFAAADLVVQDDYLYTVGSDARLRVVDISDPTHPEIRGSWQAPSYIWAVDVQGEYAYVGLRDRGFYVIDVSDPDRPQRVGFYNARPYIRQIDVMGDYAYLAATDDGLRILDVSEPDNPREVGFIDFEGLGFGVMVRDDIAYVASYWGGLRTIDISDPAHPRHLDSLGFRDEVRQVAYHVFIAANLAYVSANTAGFHIVDISDPSDLQEVGFWDEIQASYLCSNVSERFAVIGISGSPNNINSSIRVLNVSDPEHPFEVGYFERNSNYRLVFQGRYVYAEGENLCIYDITEAMGTPRIEIAEEDLEHDFGEVRMAEGSEWNLTIRNVGYPDLIIEALEVDDDAFNFMQAQRIWSQSGGFAAGELAGDNRLGGVAFDGERFYVSGGDDGSPDNFIYIFDRDGEMVERFPQFAESNWGIRDLAWDGELLWGADGRRLYGFTTDGELATQFNTPLELCRAVAWDTQRELLWIADVSSDIVGMDRAGNEVERLEHPEGQRIYGLACWEVILSLAHSRY